VELAGGRVEEAALVIELEDLGGRKRLRGYDVFSLVQY
jgi:adenine/guanine phosphoribosyltransferase-like PRPP-binding protein